MVEPMWPVVRFVDFVGIDGLAAGGCLLLVDFGAS